MIKNIIFSLCFISLIPTSSLATIHLIRFCRLTSGTFLVLPIDNDSYGFCFQGPAVIDSLSLMLTVTNQEKTQAVNALNSGKDCFTSGGSIVFSSDTSFSSTALCKFKDQSFIGALSLGNAPAGHNDQLLKALATRF